MYLIGLIFQEQCTYNLMTLFVFERKVTKLHFDTKENLHAIRDHL